MGGQMLVLALAGEQMVVAKGTRSFCQALETPISLSFDLCRCHLIGAASAARI